MESLMRIDAPMFIGVIRSDFAQTGAPANARTAATPVLLRNVLFPDMFEPLMMSRRRVGSRRSSLAIRRDAGIRGCPSSAASNLGAPSSITGIANEGFSYANDERED